MGIFTRIFFPCSCKSCISLNVYSSFGDNCSIGITGSTIFDKNATNNVLCIVFVLFCVNLAKIILLSNGVSTTENRYNSSIAISSIVVHNFRFTSIIGSSVCIETS